MKYLKELDVFIDAVTGEVYEYFNIDKLGYKQYKIKGKKNQKYIVDSFMKNITNDVENVSYQKKEDIYIHNDVKLSKEVLRTQNRITDSDIQI